MPQPLTVAIFWEDDEGKSKPRVEPGRLVIDSRQPPGSVEFHSFVDRDVELQLPEQIFGPAATRVVPAGRSLSVRVVDSPARVCKSYRARLVGTNLDAQGGSMPRMIVLP